MYLTIKLIYNQLTSIFPQKKLTNGKVWRKIITIGVGPCLSAFPSPVHPRAGVS